MEALEFEFLRLSSSQLASPYCLNYCLSGTFQSNTEEWRGKEHGQSIRGIGVCEVNLHCQLDDGMLPVTMETPLAMSIEVFSEFYLNREDLPLSLPWGPRLNTEETVKLSASILLSLLPDYGCKVTSASCSSCLDFWQWWTVSL